MNDLNAVLAAVQQFMGQGRVNEAQALLRDALARDPGNVHLNNAMGLSFMSVGDLPQARVFIERALAARPDEPVLLVNLGRIEGSLGLSDDSLARFERAATLAPAMIEAREGLAQMLRIKERYTDAAEQAALALRTHPDDPSMAALYCGLLMHTARVAEAASFAKSWLDRHFHPAVAAAYAAAMTYHPDATPRQVYEAQVMFGRIFDNAAFTPHGNDRAPDRPLRVGILSHELRRHAVATFLEGWFEHHDRSRIQLFCYPTAPVEDEVSARIKAASAGWFPVASLPDEAVARRLRADRIDVLIETSGLTDGGRLGVVALRPAPVQATMIGYLNTTGVRALGYRIVDGHTDPPGAETFSVEKLVRLEPTYWCYRPREDAPPPRAAAGGTVTFGSFNTASKLNDRVIALWARILNKVPGSRLLLKSFDFADARLRADLAARFAGAGADPHRLEIEGPTAGAAFLANYHRVDIALDPFPFCGTTTTMDALWMGVPVITLAGQRHAGRTGVSILSALGEPGLIAATEDDYADLAASLAGDAARREGLATGLRDRLRASPLCDARGFATRMDAAVRTMWHAWCRP